MRKISAILWLVLAISLPAYSQYASRIRPAPALPATCNPLNGEVLMLTAGAGVSPALYNCTGTNQWRPAGATGNQFIFNQGTITTSQPVIRHTVTWNNGLNTFSNFISDTTDTASGIPSYLILLRVGGAPRFFVDKNGAGYLDGGITISPFTNYSFTGTSRIISSVDGTLSITNNAITNFNLLTLGPTNVAFSAIRNSPAAGGQSQGIIIQRADGTDQVQANLGAAQNGSIIYCSDCTIANPCAGGGTGAIAKRLNGVWVCN